jgi:hypothetical protein
VGTSSDRSGSERGAVAARPRFTHFFFAGFFLEAPLLIAMSEDKQRTWVESRMRPLNEYDFNRRNVWRKYKGMPRCARSALHSRAA